MFFLKKIPFSQDNEISTFKRGTFHSQANPALSVLDLSFNRIPSVDYDAFRFSELTRLLLNDNRIARVETKSFVDMTKLAVLSLEGNKVRKRKIILKIVESKYT